MGRVYWGRSEGRGRGRVRVEGIVVVFAWLSSEERHMKPFVQLYASLGWNSLICHSDFLHMFFSEKATSLAVDVLNELAKEVKTRPLPIVFAAFSGGPKACMYKVLQIIDGNCESQLNLEDYQVIKNCISGSIYDSCPVDFTSDLGTNFLLHPTVLKMSQPPRILSWFARGIASGLDFLFLSRFEEQRAEYWQTLYSSVNKGPVLILCSEEDDLAPYKVIYNFSQHLQDLGGNVKLVKWKSSPHVGHYKHYPIEYKTSVTELLLKASEFYAQRLQVRNRQKTALGGESSKISESVCHLRKAAETSHQSLRRVAIGPSDHFFLPSSVEYHEIKDVGSVQDEQKQSLIRLQNPPSINAHGVLGKILFDVCVPNGVEDWELKPDGSLDRRQSDASRRHGPFNPIKCICRSRL